MRFVLLLSAALIPHFSYAATFESFDVPGAYGTCASAIASNGLVAGSTLVPESVGAASQTSGSRAPVVTPFLYANGRQSYPHVNMPPGTVSFTGVNRERFITASAFNENATAPSIVNFLYHNGKVTFPSAGNLPVLRLLGISDNNVLLGQSEVQPTGGYPFARPIGFLLRKNGEITVIDDGRSEISPRAMDANAHQVVGTALGIMSGGWVFKAGVFKPVSYPGAAFTTPTGVDTQGTVSGSYVIIDNASGNTSTHGFFLRHGVYKTYDAPLTGVTGTSIEGMNEAGQFTGCYANANGTHGFTSTQ
jgi:hypothetical protein